MFWRLKGSKVKRRTSCALLALVLLPVALSGQRYSFKHYDRDTGLPNLSVTTLLQDRTGFLWVGTENGLFRYDGRRFRSFTTADGLPSSRVEGLEQTRDGTQTVRSSSGSLLSIVNDILDLSRIEAGKLCLDATVFDLPELAGAAIGNVAPQAQQKRLELMSHIGDGVPRSLVGDPLRLRQVLINLLNNAVKFTERGGVSLQVNGEEGTESPLLHFEVVETGIGLFAGRWIAHPALRRNRSGPDVRGDDARTNVGRERTGKGQPVSLHRPVQVRAGSQSRGRERGNLPVFRSGRSHTFASAGGGQPGEPKAGVASTG